MLRGVVMGRGAEDTDVKRGLWCKGGFDVEGRLNTLIHRGHCSVKESVMCYSTFMRLGPLTEENFNDWTSAIFNSRPLL